MANYIQPNTAAPATVAGVGGVPVVNGNPLGITTVAPYVENVSDFDDPHLTIRGTTTVHAGANWR